MTIKETQLLAKQICSENGLTKTETDLICAVINGESSFRVDAVNKNKNGTSDYGLCQFNTGKNKKGVPYWIGKGADFKDINEVLTNPRKNIEIMIREYKRGNLKWWVAFSSGRYKKCYI